MDKKNPATKDGVVDLLAGIRSPITASSFQVQILMSRHALPLQTAALVAALAFEGTAHG